MASSDSVTAHVTTEALPDEPRYMFSGPHIAIGGYADQAQQEAEIATTFGSMQWLWSEDDDVRFRRSDRKLHSALLQVPETWCSVPETISVWTEVPVTYGGLLADLEEQFNVPQASVQWSDEYARHLVCLQEPELPSGSEKFRLRFARGTDLLFSDSQLVGWMVTDPARYLTSGWEPCSASEPDEDTRSLLGACLRLTASPVVEEIMDGNPTAWSRLRQVEEALRNQANDRDRARILLSTVSRLIDDNL